jgi:hypothetical protein
MKLLSLFLFVFLLTSCASQGSKAYEVLKRASFDLSCDSKAIEIYDLGSNSFGAVGCGRKGAYVVTCDDFAQCTAVLNSKVE